MVDTRVGSLALLNSTLSDVTNTQTKLGALQAEISSGDKSQNFEGLNGSVEQFTQVTGQLDRATQYNSGNALNITKLQTADVALGKISDIADQIKTTIISANGADMASTDLPQIVNDLLTSMGSELNTTFNGAYIFGGTDGTNPPVASTAVSNNALGVPDANYYTGSQQDSTMRIDDHTVVTFPVRADDVAFQKIYAAAKQAIAAAQNGDADGLTKAQQLIQSGEDDLSALRSKEGATVDNIQSVDDRLKQLSTYWTQLTDGDSKTDIVAASTQVSSLQAVLQATFQVYARLSSLHLADYLK